MSNKRYKVGDIVLTKDNCVCIVLSLEKDFYNLFNLNDYLSDSETIDTEKIKQFDNSGIETRITHSYDFTNLLSSLTKKIHVIAKMKSIELPF